MAYDTQITIVFMGFINQLMEICLFIDGEQLGLPIKNGGSFHGELLNNQRLNA